MAGPASANIMVMGADGTNVHRVTNGTGNYGFPGWSPDARRIVFRAAGKDDNGLRILDTATQAVTTLTTGLDNFPSWSPKGDRIAFTSDRDGDYEIYTIKPDGTDVQRLTSVPGNEAHSAWSPDGEWIAFASARGGFRDESALNPNNPQSYADIYVMRADGTHVRRVTDNQFEEGSPAWTSAEP
jgi:Tol biopolymer transport system component